MSCLSCIIQPKLFEVKFEHKLLKYFFLFRRGCLFLFYKLSSNLNKAFLDTLPYQKILQYNIAYCCTIIFGIVPYFFHSTIVFFHSKSIFHSFRYNTTVFSIHFSTIIFSTVKVFLQLFLFKCFHCCGILPSFFFHSQSMFDSFW